MKKIVIKLIRFYQYFSRTILSHNTIPFLFSPVCKFYPSCSDYSIEVINKYGFWKGSYKSLIRILKCNPLVTNH